MGLRDFLVSTRRLFHVTDRPTRDEYFLLLKISLLGLLFVGFIGFIVRILFLFVGLTPQQP